MAHTLREHWNQVRQLYAKMLSETIDQESQLFALRDINGIESVVDQRFLRPPIVYLSLDRDIDGAEVVKQILAKLHLTIAHREFDEVRGEICWKIPNVTLGDGKTVTIKMHSSTACPIETYEEEVVVPAQPEHVEKKTKYRLVDPEACMRGLTFTELEDVKTKK